MDNEAMKEALKRKRGSSGYMIIVGEPEISIQKRDEGSDMAPEPEESEHVMPDGSAMKDDKMVPGQESSEMSAEEKYKMLFGGNMSDADKILEPKSLRERAAKEFAAKYKKA